jgi:hypothetical protein
MTTHGAIVLVAVICGMIEPSHPQVLGAVHLEVAVDHRHRVAAHPRGTDLVKECGRGLSHELFHFCSPEIPGHRFAFHVRP